MRGDAADQSQNQKREPSGEDRHAAQEVLSRCASLPETNTQEYRGKLRALEEFRAKIGGDKFDLYFGLRPPRDRIETLIADLWQGRISDEEFAAAATRDADRPVDVEMFKTFSNAYEKQLQVYSRMLQAIVGIATDQRNPHLWREREPEVDRHVEGMQTKLPLWKEQVATMFAFLAELRSDRSGEPVRCRDHSAESAHMLTSLVMDRTAEAWRRCKKIATQSRTDPSYLYPTSAAKLFYQTHLPELPRPSDLMSQLVLERAGALKALRKRHRARDGTLRQPSVSIQAEAINVTTSTLRVVEEKPKGKTRLKRKVAEDLVLEHLLRRPHDTANEVARAVGCSVGVVAESPGWKANQVRLNIAAKEGRDPKAVRLSQEVVNLTGGNIQTQRHTARRDQEAIDDEIDLRDKEMARKIGEYLREHPNASPQEVAKEVGCTAGDVEHRQSMLDRLVAEQSTSAKEDSGSKRRRDKRVDKRP